MLDLYCIRINFTHVRNCSICAYTFMGICCHKPGINPVVYVHGTLLVQWFVESLMLSFVFT
jgi:hypothetical protein